MRFHSSDRASTGGGAFFVVLATEEELHHCHVSAYGEVHYIGTSPLAGSATTAGDAMNLRRGPLHRHIPTDPPPPG